MAAKNITTPDIGSEDVSVIEVLVKPGDKINKDTSIVTLESDKATMEVPSTDAGIVKEVKVKVGDKVGTGAVLITIDAAAEAAPAPEVKSSKEDAKADSKEPSVDHKRDAKDKKTVTAEDQDKGATAAIAAEKEEEEQPKAAGEGAATKKSPREAIAATEAREEKDTRVLTGTVQTDSDVHAGPGVRRMAYELGVNLRQVPGSGPKTRILKEDVQAYVKQQLSQVTTQTPLFGQLPAIDFSKFGKVDVAPLSRIKKISGKNLQRNWMMIPHVTQFGEADITTLEEFRLSQKQELEKQNVKLTPIVFVMKAAVASLKTFPHFNASLDVTGENLVIKKYYHLGVAVDTPDGLVVPVIRDVDKKGLVELAKELATVSERARKKQLTPADMQGGCFSISSLGGIGGTAFTPIINYPEVAILGVSRTSYKPVFEHDQFVPRLMLPLSLSYDHRVIDGADGARFIMHLTQMLSDIRNLLL